ncbi:MAG TPA: dienelactone hydrolase family protein [Steroidobacteraceae bacterium]|jgi:carboxymethylenebutenolidase|nr:dienelactone hydrolase family protein [Steroidobacteraceae bacterium]
MTDIKIRASDGASFAGYLAVPKGGRGPGIVVAQEIFGVNDVMRGVCDGLAAQGYVALCPDLFWRIEPGIQITDKTDAEWKRAFELFRAFDTDLGIEDLKAALTQLKGHAACTGKVGCVGYCLGGRLAYLMSTRSDVDCSVGYYGVGLQDLLGEAKNIRKPLALHIAEKDQFTPPEAQAKIMQALKGNPLVTLYSYPGVDHAFARVGGAHYDAAAASQANTRTADFLRRHLGT